MKVKKEGMSAQEGYLWGRRLEIIVAVMLGMATLTSAWCAYQSALWGSIETFCIAEANNAGRRASEKVVFTNQLKMFDAVMFERYVSALSNEDNQLAEFLFQRFRPELKVATEAWLATQPLKDPHAPLTPFVMKEYSLDVEKEAIQLREKEAKTFTEAKDADDISDTYLFLTVIVSTALFLSGITAAFERRALQIVLLALSAITLIGSVVAMVFLPMAAK